MAASKIRLVNEHGSIIGKSELDLANLRIPDVRVFADTLSRELELEKANIQEHLAPLTSEATDAEIQDFLDKFGLQERMISALQKALAKHLAQEIHDRLFPLSEDIATRTTGDQETKVFLQGLIAGSQSAAVQQIRAQLNERK